MKARFRIDDGRVVDAVGDVLRLGRHDACEVRFDAAAALKVSGLHARIEPAAAGFRLVHLSQTNKTLLNGQPLEAFGPVIAGDVIRLGYTGPSLEVLALTADVPPPPQKSAPALDTGMTLQADGPQLSLLRGSARAERFHLGDGGVIGRDLGRVEFHLDHPLVSRRHARLIVADGRVILKDLGTANGTFVNGERLGRPIELIPGDRIDIGPYSLEFDGTAFISQSRTNNIELAARGVTRIVTDRGTCQPLTLLDGVSLVVRPREFVGLLGPSGSGKSTLLAVLSGRVAADAGIVTLNGQDLGTHFGSLKHDIAVVPQREALHETLSVEAALGYTAELRLPPDTDRDELRDSVDDILGVVGLEGRRTTLIRHLSGGQAKRASLANEILSRPTLLFLDEVTSGLDEQTDREMMELFKLIAEGGKTVVCITHNLANVEDCCHLVVILTAGGKLAFVGTPTDARAYFGVPRLGDVYRKLATKPAEDWQQAFRRCREYGEYVERRLPTVTASATVVKAKTTLVTESAAHWQQTLVLTRRMLALWAADRLALAVLLGQCVLVAVLLVMVYGVLDARNNPSSTLSLLYLLAVSSFWLGCNTAAKELVKERVIFERERAFNLRPISYFAAKFAVLTGVGLLQVAVLFVIVRLGSQPAGSIVWQGLTLALLMTAGTAVGLLISAAARTEEVATALVPIVVIPQIILGGGLAALSGVADLLARAAIAVYWGREALWTLHGNAAGSPATAIDGPLAVLALHVIIAAALAIALLHRRRS